MLGPTRGGSSLQCRICDSSGLRVALEMRHEGREYTVVRCSACGTLQALEHYESVSPDYAHLSSESIDRDRLWCQGEHKRPAFAQWLEQARQLLGGDPNGKNVLDVGCGTGGFLEFARANGFDVYGFDASAAQAAFARERFNTVRHAASALEYLGKLERGELRFDLITLWDVIEHLRDPIPFVEGLSQALTPDGLLFVSTPNATAMLWKSWVNKAFHRGADFGWAPWEHVFYYSRHSLVMVQARAGLVAILDGAVACYPRRLSAFEAGRRFGFSVLRFVPWLAPQIFSWARPSLLRENL